MRVALLEFNEAAWVGEPKVSELAAAIEAMATLTRLAAHEIILTPEWYLAVLFDFHCRPL